jgi:hypothetical protein
MLHPPYSPDIAPSDFYLFGTVKQRLPTCEGRSFEEFQENVDEIPSTLRPDELKFEEKTLHGGKNSSRSWKSAEVVSSSRK